MAANEITLTVVLALCLLGLAAYFIVQQFGTFKKLGIDQAMSAEDRAYFRAQARRRVVCSILLIVLAGFLIGGIFVYSSFPEKAAGEEQKMTDEQRGEMWAGVLYVTAMLLVLLVVLALAAVDFLATARFGLRHQRQLREE